MPLSPILPPRGPGGNTPASPGQAPVDAAKDDSKTAANKNSSADVKPLEGNTVINDKMTIECEILCYSSVNKIAAEIAREFHAMHSSPAVVIFLDATSKSALQLHRAFMLQIDLLKQEFKRAKDEAAPLTSVVSHLGEGAVVKENFLIAPLTIQAAATGATALSRSIVDLLALFRTDTSYSGRAVAVHSDALPLSLAGNLTTLGHTVVYPKFLLFPVSAASSSSAEEIRDVLASVETARDDANDAVRGLAARVAEATQKLADLQKKHAHHNKREDAESPREISEHKEQLIRDQLQLQACQKWFTDLDNQLQAMLNALNQPDANGAIPLQSLLIGQELIAKFEKAPKDTYFLHAEVVSAGGSYRIRKNLFRTLFWSDGLSYSGGSVVNFAFLDSNAAIAKSGVHHYRSPFGKFTDDWSSATFGNSFEEKTMPQPSSPTPAVNSGDRRAAQNVAGPKSAVMNQLAPQPLSTDIHVPKEDKDA